MEKFLLILRKPAVRLLCVCVVAVCMVTAVLMFNTSKNKVEQDLDLPTEEIPEQPSSEEDDSDIIQEQEKYIRDNEITVDGVMYLAQSDGIFRVDQDGENCIWEGYIQQEFPSEGRILKEFENHLYWITDIDYSQGDSEWVPDGVAWLNLQSGDNGVILLSELSFSEHYDEYELDDIEVDDGFIYLTQEPHIFYEYGDVCPLPISSPGYNGLEPADMSPEEREEYGLALSDYLRNNPGEVMDVSVRTTDCTRAWLDLDGDGSVEGIEVYWAKNDEDAEQYKSEYDCSIVMYVRGYPYVNHLMAVSLAGGEILIAMYDDGPSSDPCTTCYAYDEGRLVCVGELDTDIRYNNFEKNGDITITETHDIIETAALMFTYRMSGEHRFELVEQESYDVYRYAEEESITLLEKLTVYETPGGAVAGTLAPGEVKYTKAYLGKGGNSYETDESAWIYIEGDDAAGWVEVAPYGKIVELDKDSQDVFEGLVFFG